MEIVATDDPQARMRLAPQPHWLEGGSIPRICSSVLYSLVASAAGLVVLAAIQTLEPIATLDLRMMICHPYRPSAQCWSAPNAGRSPPMCAFVRCLVHAQSCPEPVAAGDATFMRGTRGRRFDYRTGNRSMACPVAGRGPPRMECRYPGPLLPP